MLKDRCWTLFSTYGAYKQWYTLAEFAETDFQRPGFEISLELTWYEFAFVPIIIAASRYYGIIAFELGPVRLELFVRWAEEIGNELESL